MFKLLESANRKNIFITVVLPALWTFRKATLVFLFRQVGRFVQFNAELFAFCLCAKYHLWIWNDSVLGYPKRRNNVLFFSFCPTVLWYNTMSKIIHTFSVITNKIRLKCKKRVIKKRFVYKNRSLIPLFFENVLLGWVLK